MLTSLSYTPQAMLRVLNRTLGGYADAEVDISSDWREPGGNRIVYLAGGYWRAQLVVDASGLFRGVRLINPDLTGVQIQTVEQGLAILLHMPYAAT